MKSRRETKKSVASEPSLVLTVREAAGQLRASERTVWRLVSAGQLSTVQVGRAVRVTRESIQLYVSTGGAR